MALADTSRAIGAASEAIRERLATRTNLNVTLGRPEPTTGSKERRLNLFLYEALFDPSLKNVSLDDNQPPPLWLVLKYLLTAFDDGKESDTYQALEYLGLGISALQESNFLSLTAPFMEAGVLPALIDNPERLKITFDETTSDLISKVMQGTDERYRFSVGFQVRPVMIATNEPPAYSLLVGVDYTTAPPGIVGDSGVQIPVIPSIGPSITGISPVSFEVGSTVSVSGTDLNLSGLSVLLGEIELPVIAQRANELKFKVDANVVTGEAISAGSHPLAVVQTLPTGRRKSSNLLIGHLRPTVSAASVVAGSVTEVVGSTPKKVFGEIALTGLLLGTKDDDSLLALYKDGQTIKVFDAFTDEDIPPTPAPVPAQTTKTLRMKDAGAVPPGEYLLIYRVNNQQAKMSPLVEIVP